jgi:hypothetical protein
MIQSNHKTSLLVPYELPKFISEDPNYANFVLFVQAYYEWMEQQNNTLDYSKNLLNHMDVDSTTDEFLQYYLNDFLSFFPQEILSDKAKAIKIAKQLYQSKGTPASYKFLFRVLYNSDVEFLYTKDVLLKASSGKWYVPRSLKLATADKNFLNIQNLRLFGNISKSIATVETAIFDGLKTEVFISNIERLFQSGETVTVVDANNQPIYFLNDKIVSKGTVGSKVLTALIVGQISQVKIDPNYRGLSYAVGDPVVFSGGLNANVAGAIGASAIVNSVTSGSVKRVTIVNEGFGYTISDANSQIGGANTFINVTNLFGTSPKAPIITVGSLNPTGIANVTFIPTDSIQLKQYHYLGNIAGSSGANTYNSSTGLWTQQKYQFANLSSANANTTLANAFTFTAFSTFPLSSVIVQNQGGGLSAPPSIEAISEYTTDVYSQTKISNLGILAPIKIINPGSGYANNDQIAILGGSGYGAFANVTVNSSGSIVSTAYVSDPSNRISLGGMGYMNGLPVAVVKRTANGNVTVSNTSTVVTGNGTNFTTQFSNGALLVTNTNIVIGTVQSVVNANSMILTANASVSVNANSYYLGTSLLSVPGILGTGATFSQTLDRVGAITSFEIIDNGQDYVAAPTVSLRVQDLIVSNVSVLSIPTAGDIIYQGANVNTATYLARVDSINALENFVPANNSIYQLRVYNYNSIPKKSLPLKIDSKGAAVTLVGGYTNIHNTTFDNNITNTKFDSANGVISYGDGYAKANATFLNGLVIGSGQYLDNSGQPSSYDVLQSLDYNNYTYQITLSKEIEKYRDILLNLLHPTGTKVIGRIAMRSSNKMNFNLTDALDTGYRLSYYAGLAATATISSGTAQSPSNNIIKFDNLYGANISNFITANTTEIVFSYGNRPTDSIHGLVVSINDAANTVTLQDNVWTHFANVAIGTSAANGNNRIINISSLTYSYNIVNNGNYSNTAYPVLDMIRVGDTITVNGAAQTVTSFTSPYTSVNLSGPLANGANGFISVSRGMTSFYDNVQIIGPVGTQYLAQLGTENGNILTTETGTWLLIG